MGNNKIVFDNDVTNTYIYANTDNPEDLEIHADEDILLMADGQVGIKNSTPTHDLDVTGDIGVTGAIYPSVGSGSLAKGITVNPDDSVFAATTGIVQPVNMITVGTAISQTIGKIYNLSSTGWVEGDASSATNSTSMLAISNATQSSNLFMLEGLSQQRGTNIGGTFVLGAPLYLSDTATGRMTFDVPGSTNEVVRIVGHAVRTLVISSVTYYVIYFKPSNDWIEL